MYIMSNHIYFLYRLVGKVNFTVIKLTIGQNKLTYALIYMGPDARKLRKPVFGGLQITKAQTSLR